MGSHSFAAAAAAGAGRVEQEEAAILVGGLSRHVEGWDGGGGESARRLDVASWQLSRWIEVHLGCIRAGSVVVYRSVQRRERGFSVVEDSRCRDSQKVSDLRAVKGRDEVTILDASFEVSACVQAPELTISAARTNSGVLVCILRAYLPGSFLLGGAVDCRWQPDGRAPPTWMSTLSSLCHLPLPCLLSFQSWFC
jgi:hypothetical protein